MANLIRQLFATSDASGSKSTILKPLTWLISILIGGILLLLRIEAPFWVLIFFIIVSAITLLLFFVAYVYCLLTDKDALRSETYSIQKMAIEKGVYGDSVTGLVTINKPEDEIKLIGSSEEVDKQNG